MRNYYVLIMTLLAAGTVSCSKDLQRMTPDRQVILMPAVETTKSAISSAVIPDNYTIHLSAYLIETETSPSGNYLIGEQFNKNGMFWKSNPPVLWPIDANMNFLALATNNEDTTVTKSAVWYDKNVARSVELPVRDGTFLDTEILYARNDSDVHTDGTVEMTFRHAQSWLRFEFANKGAEDMRIDSLVMVKPYLGGTLRVNNEVYLECNWDFHGHFKKDYTIPETRFLTLSEDKTQIDVLVPEQESCSFRMYYRVKSKGEPSWDNSRVTDCYVAPAIADPWHSGTKTIYTMTMESKITFTATVIPWNTENIDVTVVDDSIIIDFDDSNDTIEINFKD